MKKKAYVFSLIVILSLFIFWYLSTGVSRNMGTSYSSVKEFQLKCTKEFYDFYAPQYYFNNANKKQTLTELNNIDIWYQGSADSYYSITFKGTLFEQEILQKDIELTYSVSNFTEDEFKKIEMKYELIDDIYNIYSYFNGKNVFVVHNHDNREIVEIILINMNEQLDNDLFLEKMNPIVYEIMKDSIKLNEMNN
ncbi:MAG: hypothetical protein KHZ15_09460 [Coprobacillus cateniformis]|uniref:hypothetical protein n=1 Tax=Longibaculum muris TaxID=1796628 RepID=UPI003AB68D8A|nr:hypothetical protein [Coprobacillus cateniformis]